jgi:hypothetical protein
LQVSWRILLSSAIWACDCRWCPGRLGKPGCFSAFCGWVRGQEITDE